VDNEFTDIFTTWKIGANKKRPAMLYTPRVLIFAWNYFLIIIELEVGFPSIFQVRVQSAIYALFSNGLKIVFFCDVSD